MSCNFHNVCSIVYPYDTFRHQWNLYLVDSEDLLSLEVLISELLTRESQFPDNVPLVILFNNMNFFLLLVQHGPALP